MRAILDEVYATIDKIKENEPNLFVLDEEDDYVLIFHENGSLEFVSTQGWQGGEFRPENFGSRFNAENYPMLMDLMKGKI